MCVDDGGGGVVRSLYRLECLVMFDSGGDTTAGNQLLN